MQCGEWDWKCADGAMRGNREMCGVRCEICEKAVN
jgi:hypothetical protein